MFRVDPESPLATDLRQLERDHKQDHLLFHFVFKDSFPYVIFEGILMISAQICFSHFMRLRSILIHFCPIFA